MINFEERDRQLQNLFGHYYGSILIPNLKERCAGIEDFWEKIKSDEMFLEEAVQVIKNKYKENTINGLATAFLLIDKHKEVPPYILSMLLKNIFTVFEDEGCTKRLFKIEIHILGDVWSYLSRILVDNDLILDSEYQQIISDYLINERDNNFSNNVGFFLRRDNVEEKFKMQILKSLSDGKACWVYNDWSCDVCNRLLYDFKIKDAFITPTKNIGKIKHKDKKINDIMQLDLKMLKLLEDNTNCFEHI